VSVPSDSRASETGAGRSPRRFRRRLLLTGGTALLGVVALLLWTKAASSTGFCTSCHVTDAAVASAGESVHADVACIDCHVDAGAKGALRYVPSLLREVVQEATGWHTARGVLSARSCASCHEPRKSGDITPEGDTTVHPDPESSCTSCHGDVAHPGRPVPISQDHPANYQQLHGRDVSLDGSTECARCHEQPFCRSCHVYDPAPHPKDWMATHGTVQTAEGRSCTLCHAPETFCKACHGTVVPHPADWLSTHPREAALADQTLCTTCHTREACDRCHEKHAAHSRENGEPAP